MSGDCHTRQRPSLALYPGRIVGPRSANESLAKHRTPCDSRISKVALADVIRAGTGTGRKKDGSAYMLLYANAAILAQVLRQPSSFEENEDLLPGEEMRKESARDNADKAEPLKPKVLHVMATSSPHCSVCAV